MLYVTTRSGGHLYSPIDALSNPYDADGGLFVPQKEPHWDSQDIRVFADSCFAETIAQIVNLFFETNLDRWTIEFAIGRQPIRLEKIDSKIWIAELWNNPAWKYDMLALGIEKAIRQSDQVNQPPADWLKIVGRVASLCGIYGLLLQKKAINFGDKIDVAVSAGDFSVPIAVWYARSWGLPIGEILCSTNANNAIWSLLTKGEMRAGAISSRTHTTESDTAVPLDFERLIYSVYGAEEVNRFCKCCRSGTIYRLDDHSALSEGIFASVVGEKRIESMLLHLYNSYRYFADPHTALAYAGIMDYRSKIGENHMTVVLSETGPVHYARYLSGLLSVSNEEMLRRISFIEE